MKKVFIGIDFSKLKFDAAIFLIESKSIVSNEVFDNDHSGYIKFLKWVKENTSCQKFNQLFCGEHTGFYSANLSTFLYDSGHDLWLVSGLQIKLSQGIKRAKTDRMVACKIAEYAFRYQDKINLFKPISNALEQIRDLLSYRERLVETRKVLSTSAKEMKRVKETISCDFIYLDSLDYIKSLGLSIRNCESRIEALINEDISLSTNYKLINSVIGIGLVNATLILVATSNFSAFSNPRKFGCYCGVVPFEYTSGSSIRGKTRVSKLANKNIKTKLIHRIFAVIRDQKMYDKTYLHP